jgi:hypothetical protein
MNVQYGRTKTCSLCIFNPLQKKLVLLEVTTSHFSFSATELRKNGR